MILIADTVLPLQLDINVSIRRNDTIAPPSEIPGMARDLVRNQFFADLQTQRPNFLLALREKLTIRFNQMKKGEAIQYNTIKQWIDADLGSAYQQQTLQMRARSTDGRDQIANTAGSTIYVRSIETIKFTLNITFT